MRLGLGLVIGLGIMLNCIFGFGVPWLLVMVAFGCGRIATFGVVPFRSSDQSPFVFLSDALHFHLFFRVPFSLNDVLLRLPM